MSSQLSQYSTVFIGDYILVVFFIFNYFVFIYCSIISSESHCFNCCNFITFLNTCEGNFIHYFSFEMFLEMILTHNLFIYFKMWNKNKNDFF